MEESDITLFGYLLSMFHYRARLSIKKGWVELQPILFLNYD